MSRWEEIWEKCAAHAAPRASCAATLHDHLPAHPICPGRHTQPAYLICTDPEPPIEELLQEYIWRWDIEVNHRDEKTILGVGQARVRNKHSVQSVPAAGAAALAMLHLAALKAYGLAGRPAAIPPAKWRDPSRKHRASTQNLVNELRRELWAKTIRPDVLCDFHDKAHPDTKSPKFEPDICRTLFAATS